MNVKSKFLNGDLKEKVYVKQPPGFEHEKYPNYVYGLIKALYGLRQAPHAWYERLSKFLLSTGFIRDYMQKEFDMSLMGELQYFLGMQVVQ